MKVAVDAMGGDHAPETVVEGAVLAARAHGVPVVLVGDAPRLEECLAAQKTRGLSLEVHHASDAIAMDEHGAKAIRRKKDSSLRVCFDLAKRGEVSAVVSAGNSGAVMAGALLILGRLEGVDRPAIASAMPTTAGGRVLLLDAGANPEAKPLHLAQWALCGEAYARRILGIARPKVALLSNGEEESKGTTLTRAAYGLLAQSGVEFVGYLEGRDIFAGRCDVLVTDGFTGNVVLKTVEGAASGMAMILKEEIEATRAARVGYLLLRGALKRFQRRLDYAEYGGAPILGVDGTAIVAHGASNATAIKNAVRVARDLAREDLGGALSDAARRASELSGAQTNNDD
ncbi:MAG: phosphate acyltransferase PlsX [Deltaproteobacteria bacterium]|nr:phosphate acyltransferase PlsX [Deltaproteobacteria bacterium]